MYTPVGKAALALSCLQLQRFISLGLLLDGVSSDLWPRATRSGDLSIIRFRKAKLLGSEWRVIRREDFGQGKYGSGTNRG